MSITVSERHEYIFLGYESQPKTYIVNSMVLLFPFAKESNSLVAENTYVIFMTAKLKLIISLLTLNSQGNI